MSVGFHDASTSSSTWIRLFQLWSSLCLASSLEILTLVLYFCTYGNRTDQNPDNQKSTMKHHVISSLFVTLLAVSLSDVIFYFIYHRSLFTKSSFKWRTGYRSVIWLYICRFLDSSFFWRFVVLFLWRDDVPRTRGTKEPTEQHEAASRSMHRSLSNWERMSCWRRARLILYLLKAPASAYSLSLHF